MRSFSDRGFLAALGALCAILLAAVALAIAGSADASGAPDDAAIAVPTPTATVSSAQTSTPEPGADGLALDYARAVDLGRLRVALDAYFARYATYPDTGGAVALLCETLRSAGCDLREVASSLMADVAFGDGESRYWYQSDGATYFVLIARASLDQDQAACPSSLPEPLSEGPVMCLRGGAP